MRFFAVLCGGLCLGGCFTSGFNAEPSFPKITDIFQAPSDQFVLDSIGLAKVSRAHPFKGSNTGCGHPGAQLHFSNTGAPYIINIYSPVEGAISAVRNCQNTGASDRYGFDISFANFEDNVVSFVFNVEPQDGTPCSPEDGDITFFNQYISVSLGQQVVEGDILGQLIKTNSGNDNANVEMYLQVSGEQTNYCPNVFSSTVEATFGGLYGSETCNGTAFGSNTFCFNPTNGEDLTGL